MAVTVTYSFEVIKDLGLFFGPPNGNMDLTVLANGGFAAVGDNGSYATLNLFNADGTLVGGQSQPIGYASVATAQLANGNIAVVSMGSESQQYQNLGFLSILSGNGTFVVPLDNFTTTGEAMSGVDVATLTSGNFVAVAGSSGGTISARIMGPGGAELLYVEVASGLYSKPVVAALDDGGFVVAWEFHDNGDVILYRAVYNANGSLRQGPLGFDTASTPGVANSMGELDITATANGFAIVYQTTTVSANTDIAIKLFDSNGALLSGGGTLTGPATIDETPRITRMPNGLLGVSFGFATVGPADSDTDVVLFDPVSGTIVAERIVTGGEPQSDDTDFATLVSHGTGRVAVFHTNRTDNLPNGEELQAVRTSTGNGADDSMAGSLYADVFNGGGGSDTVDYSTAAAGVTVSLANSSPQNVGGGQGSDTLISVENLNGSAFADTLTGNGSANRFFGFGGNDTMTGGLGNDIYGSPDAGDIIVEAAGGGFDTIETFNGSFSLAAIANVEALTYVPFFDTLDFIGTGNGLANRISGDAGDDTINGLGGTDTMIGFAGDDRYYVDNAGDVVTEGAGQGTGDRVLTSVNYTLGATAQVELFTTTNAAGTGALNLTGNGFAQTIAGNAGNNIIDGKGGADNMQGFAGDDWYYVDNTGDVVLDGAGQGTADRVFASVSIVLTAGAEIEILSTTTGAGTAAINFTGNGFSQSIGGNAGNNVLYGGGGNDSMVGFGGNDSYFVDSAGDSVLEQVGGGAADRVSTSISYTLTSGQEIELFTTTNSAGTGAINLTGNNLAQSIGGNAGANVLNGGAGNDTLTGFGGADTFFFNTALAGNIDRIADYNVAQDTIRLENAIFAGLATGALAAGAFNTGAAATQADDRIIYNAATGGLIFDADGLNGNAGIRFASLSAGLALTAADFAVV